MLKTGKLPRLVLYEQKVLKSTCCLIAWIQVTTSSCHLQHLYLVRTNIFRIRYVCRPVVRCAGEQHPCLSLLIVMRRPCPNSKTAVFRTKTLATSYTRGTFPQKQIYHCLTWTVLLMYFAVHALGTLKHVAVMLLRSTICI